MYKIRTICLLTSLFISAGIHSQEESNAKIDSISIKLIQCFQEDDLSMLDYHFVIKSDIEYLIDSLQDKMSEEEIENAKSEMDSIPKSARMKWQKKFTDARNKMSTKITDWNRINYLSSDIEIKIDESVLRELAKVSAKFEFADETYLLNYDCINMPRGWIFGNALSIEPFENE